MYIVLDRVLDRQAVILGMKANHIKRELFEELVLIEKDGSLTHSFYIMKYELTQEAYEEITGENPEFFWRLCFTRGECELV